MLAGRLYIDPADALLAGQVWCRIALARRTISRCPKSLFHSARRFFHQPLEFPQTGWVGNLCSTKKHHAAFFVHLQKRIRNVGTGADELHYVHLSITKISAAPALGSAVSLELENGGVR